MNIISFYRASTKEDFLSKLESNEIPSNSIVFIEDSSTIYHNGIYYKSLPTTTETEGTTIVTVQDLDTIETSPDSVSIKYNALSTSNDLITKSLVIPAVSEESAGVMIPADKADLSTLSDEYIREHRLLRGKFASQQFTSDLGFRPSTVDDYKITLNGITYTSETPEFEFILEKDLILEGADFGGIGKVAGSRQPLFEMLVLPKCTIAKESSNGHFWWLPKMRFLDVSKLDTSNLVNATNMFYDYWEQNTVVKGIDDLDYSNVENITSFVNEARIPYNPTLYNLSKCKHIGFLFSYQDLDLKMASLYAPIFETCEFLFWESSGTVDFTGYSLPNSATNLTGLFKKSTVNIIGMENLDVSNVTEVGQLFYEYTGTPPKFNNWTTSQITGADYMFAGIKTDVLDLTGLTFPNCTSALHFCSATNQGKNSPITTINFGNLSFENLPSGNESAFWDLNHLTTITGTLKWSPNSSIDFGVSPLTNESAMVIINSLPETTSNVWVLFKKAVYDALTEEQIAVATSKGWTVKSYNN